MDSETILIIGANGQIGSVLTEALRAKYPKQTVLATDIREPESPSGPFTLLNVLDKDALEELVSSHRVSQIYHLAAILSAKGELDPLRTWDINMQSLFNVLEVARTKAVKKVFFPSSIAVFGPEANKKNTDQFEALTPRTVYGISKVAGENWCQYYFDRYGLDVRSVRYPGIIGHQSMPGGGTTDYAVEIFHEAIKNQSYSCFLNRDTRLPMMFMEDAIRATISIMDAPAEQVKIRSSYNLAGMSFTPEELAEEIQKHIPDFKISYAPDHREQIARSWPESINDQSARTDWNWQEKYDLARLTETMIRELKAKILV
ncbi:MAG: NAD-dependent epimerase/dehydratase family protein [Saprospiraceae bacterium]|nr:NAD-dependent epimerase/dehydratase family protein [Saprospiraceae bacterium]